MNEMNYKKTYNELQETIERLNEFCLQQQTNLSSQRIGEIIGILKSIYNVLAQFFGQQKLEENEIQMREIKKQRKEIRKEGNKLWNVIVRNSIKIEKKKQIELRQLSCFFVQFDQEENDFNLVKMLGKTAKMMDEIGEKQRSNEMYEKMNQIFLGIEKNEMTEQEKKEFVNTSKIIYLYQMNSAWDNGEIDKSWIFYNKLKGTLTYLSKENHEEIKIVIFNKAYELYEKNIYQESINWMKEYLLLSHTYSMNYQEKDEKYENMKKQEGYKIISQCYFELGIFEEAMKYIEKSLEIEKTSENEFIYIKCLLTQTFLSSSGIYGNGKNEKEIEMTIKNYLIHSMNSFKDKSELLELLEQSERNENISIGNHFTKDMIIFGYENMMNDILSQPLINKEQFYFILLKYIRYLFGKEVMNIVLSQNTIGILLETLRKKQIEIDEREIRKIIIVLWERGIKDCINKNERIGKEWFCKVEELMEITNINDEIGEIKKNIAICELHLQNYQEAIIKSKESITLGSKKLESEFILFTSLMKINNYEEASIIVKNSCEKKDISNEEKISFLESCCFVSEEMKIKDISIMMLKMLFSSFSISLQEKNEVEIKKGFGILLFRELMTKIDTKDEQQILEQVVKMIEYVSQKENGIELIIGNEKGEIEWSLAYLYNLTKKSYCLKEYEKCYLSSYIYKCIIETCNEYQLLYENKILVILLGLASKIEYLQRLKTNDHFIENEKEKKKQYSSHSILTEYEKFILNEMNSYVKVTIENAKKINAHLQNDIEKLEITHLLIEIKFHMLCNELIDEDIKKLFGKGANASIIELIGMNMLEQGYRKEGIECLKMGITTLCKQSEIDGIRLSRLIREIIKETNEYENIEMINKAMTIIQNTQNIYPSIEIEYLLSYCWNTGNKWRYLHEQKKAQEWYSKALLFLSYLPQKIELKNILEQEFASFQCC